MSHRSIDPASFRSLAILVESVAIPLLRDHTAPICLEVDIDHGIEVPTDPAATTELVRTVTRHALAVMPSGGDLTITGVEVDGRVELEFADTGEDIEARVRRLPLAAAAIGAEIRWQNCPQGGGAVTITFPGTSESQRLAA